MARKQKRYHFIYKTTNLLSGKYYIGMHSTNNLDDGYLGSGKRLRYSINKYGEEHHNREIMEFVDSREELKNREREIVNLDEIAKNDCMNLCVGGEGGFSVEQQKENARKSNDRQKELRETNPEWVDKKSESITKSLLKSYEIGVRKKGVFCDWTGKKHREESKRKIGDKNSIAQKGSGNSQYGTCWITKKCKSKKIKKEKLNLFLDKGWKKGRKIK